jgi:hypothetical protein
MPLYVIEREFAEQFDATESGTDAIRKVLDANQIAGVEWLFSFLSADRKKTYCLYEASSPEAIREAARIAGIPADSIIEVGQIAPETFGFPASVAEVPRVGPRVAAR